MKRASSNAFAGLVLVAAKLALLPFQTTLPTASLSALTDLLLWLLLAAISWKASRRSRAFARGLWLSVTIFSVLQAVNSCFGAVILALTTPEKALNAFWPTTLVFYVLFLVLALPLLLREDAETLAIGWLQTLDAAQLGILTLSAYLVFFYIPLIGGSSNEQRLQHFTVMHLMRNGFLILGFVYRGWRSRSPDLRQLQFRYSAVFVGFAATASLYMRATNVWHWPRPVIGLMADLPVLFLLLIAASWQEREKAQPPVKMSLQGQGLLWRHALPLLVPFSVIALAFRISNEHPRVAWSAITLSFICYAARLLLMQRRQEATWSSLAVMEEKFSKAFQASPVAIAISRLSDGKYLDANDRYLELLALRKEEVVGKTSLELGIFTEIEQRNKFVETVRKQNSVQGRPFRLRRADRVLDTLVSAEVIRLEEESLLISSVVDVTELKNVTHQLQQAQKMELVGSLAGGVAHDFNNLLTIIKGYSELARMRGVKGELADEIRQIGEAADRAAALTRQLLAFSRRQLLQPRNIGLNSVMTGIEKMLRRTIGENIELVNFLASDLGTVHADPGQMEQVVINLAINSRDAMPNGGKLVFQTRNLELSSPYVETGFQIPLGHYVVLTATDTGTGIAPEHLDRVFEPFFTTKQATHGTGLGLSTVYGIVKQSGGYISVYSEVGLGTTFKIYLPRVDKPAETIKPTEPETRSLDGTETILIAEDDQRVCELAANILRQHGYNVLTANSGEEALRRAQEFTGEIHLLLTDIVMTSTGGYELAHELKQLRPAVKVLFMSGYPHFSLSDADSMEFHQPILSKPFTPSELVREARKVLDCENQLASV